MKCRVIFPNATYLNGLKELLAVAGSLVRKNSKAYDANFFVFGEDILGVNNREFSIDHERRCRKQIIPHKQVLSFVPRLQSVLGPSDFVIFSLYATLGSSIVNAVYLVGREHWFFDFKRLLPLGDSMVLDRKSMERNRLNAKMNPKTSVCLKIGKHCIKNIYLLVCADIYILPKLRVKGGCLMFVPSCGLSDYNIEGFLSKFHGPGRLFINDPYNGHIWDISFDKKKPSPMPFGKKKCLAVDFSIS